MSSTRVKLMKSALGTMHSLGMHNMLRPLSEGLGMILTLHRVRPVDELGVELVDHPLFDPNGLLEVTPDFLDATLELLKVQGLKLISLDEAMEAIHSPTVQQGRFAVLTFDDGYIDNADHALPVLEAHDAPATIYMPSDYPQGRGELWWVALEEMIRQADSITRPDEPQYGPQSVRTTAEKNDFYLDFYWALREMSQDDQRANIRTVAVEQNYSIDALCRRLILSTPELKAINEHPLITIGAHTVTHRAMARLSAEEAMLEMVEGANWLEQTLGARPKHFSFPYGDAGSAGPRDYKLAQNAGFETAVTTRKGMLYPDHKDHMFALPRVSLNGEFQHSRYIELFASGAPFLLANRFKKVA